MSGHLVDISFVYIHGEYNKKHNVKCYIGYVTRRTYIDPKISKA